MAIRVLSSIVSLLCLQLSLIGNVCGNEPLPSWNDSAARTAILEFVGQVTGQQSPDFVPVNERIAVFDNDGTLWAEQPFYFQLLFAVERIKQLQETHPEWKTEEPFASVLQGNLPGVAAGGEEAILKIVAATHAKLTTEQFHQIVLNWLDTARHPVTGKRYTEMVYLPMLELLDYLHSHQFKTYIVSGGGIEFMRPWSEKIYGIPPEQVIGSSIKTKFEIRNGLPVLICLPEINFIDDKAGKPVAINQHIGRRPLAAFGNSDGDLQMLQWTAAGSRSRLCVLIHHTDAIRECAYDKNSHVGKLDAALTEAAEKNWTVVDMQSDWKQIFPDMSDKK